MNAPAVRPSISPLHLWFRCKVGTARICFIALIAPCGRRCVPDARQQGLAIMAAAMDPQAADAPARLQSFVVAGTKPISVLSRWMAIR